MVLADAHAFIKIRDGSFVDENCKEFFFSGYNTWQVIYLASSACLVLAHTPIACDARALTINVLK